MSRVPGQQLAGTSSGNWGKPTPEKPHLSTPAQFSWGLLFQEKVGISRENSRGITEQGVMVSVSLSSS